MRRISAKELNAVKAEMLRKQRGRCALCNMLIKENKDKCLDHSHTSGALRAVLCRNCNAMEGKVFNCARRAKRGGTGAEWIARVLRYWERHAENVTGLLHPSYKNEDEKRLKRNKKARARRKKLLNK